MSKKGLVILAGAGPGDPGLATVALMRELARAEVVVYDYLANPVLLGHAPQARLICVGKRAGEHSASQGEINALLAKLGKAGSRVLRLKGGDPFVFGRGGEEALALRAAGIPFEVIPGVTSGVAALAYAGIPLTHRGLATASVFVTGQEMSGKPLSEATLKGLAKLRATLVFYMATGHVERICTALVRHGRKAATPAALVHKGTFPGQRVLLSTLAKLPKDMAREGLGAPGLIVVGEVAGLRRKLRWFEDQPLFGRRVFVTRAREQASALAAGLRERGAEVVETPSIRIKALPLSAAALGRICKAQWLVVTSTNGAEILCKGMLAKGRDMRSLSGVKIAAIGSSTASVLQSHGLHADLVPRSFVAEALVAALRRREGGRIKGQRIVLARAAEGREALPRLLKEAGAKVDEITLYQTLAEGAKGKVGGPGDWVTFSSSSTVDSFDHRVDPRVKGSLLAFCMGPITAAAAKAHGYQVAAVSRRATIADFLKAIEGYASASR
jgi:uroporphyrinogen III methyltransferase/synthase